MAHYLVCARVPSLPRVSVGRVTLMALGRTAGRTPCTAAFTGCPARPSNLKGTRSCGHERPDVDTVPRHIQRTCVCRDGVAAGPGRAWTLAGIRTGLGLGDGSASCENRRGSQNPGGEYYERANKFPRISWNSKRAAAAAITGGPRRYQSARRSCWLAYARSSSLLLLLFIVFAPPPAHGARAHARPRAPGAAHARLPVRRLPHKTEPKMADTRTVIIIPRPHTAHYAS